MSKSIVESRYPGFWPTAPAVTGVLDGLSGTQSFSFSAYSLSSFPVQPVRESHHLSLYTLPHSWKC